MLTPTEESGLYQILDDFTDSDLFSLLFTVSRGLLNATDKKDAISKILSCIEKPSELLNRQKVTKKILFSYLLKIMPFVSPESSKADLVKMCLKEWDSIEECKNITIYEHENQNSSATTDDSFTASNSTTDAQQNNFDWLNAMGIQFAMWFFTMYNALKDFGPEHFWTDCKLMAELKTGADRREVTVVGANEVVRFLSSLVIMDKFYFDANISQDSVTSEQDPHGLIRILVSGVVHQLSNCIGLCDSFFGLVRNPAFNDNWKIKWINLKIHVNNIAPANSLPVTPLQSICPRT